MSSVASAGASRIVGAAERLRAVGRNADDNSGDATFAVKPANAAQDPESEASPPADEVVLTADAADVVAAEVLPDTMAAYAAAATLAADDDKAVAPNLDVADEMIPLVPAIYNGTPASQAAYAYAQTMQAWLESKNPRPAAPRRPTKPKAETER